MLRPRGEPLYALAMIVAGWIAVRVVMISALEEEVPARVHMPDAPASHGHAPASHAHAVVVPTAPAALAPAGKSFPVLPSAEAPVAIPIPPRAPVDPFLAPRPLDNGSPQVPLAAAIPPADGAKPGRQPMRLAGGHQLLLMAGLSYIDLPDAFQSAIATNSAQPVPQPTKPAREASRWSGGGWLLLRRGQSAAALATGAASYGGSQFGAVVRYNLAPAAAMRPQAYLRVSGAINAPFRDRQAALGLALRPLRHVPFAVLAEARAQQGTIATRLRPAIALVSEVPPLRLPLRAEGEVYGQVGWVGGRDATGFFDLQATADRSVLRPAASADLRAGAGVWSGGQRGAARLDIGPRLTLRAVAAGVPARLAMDWRFRVAGRAEPGSGPALTFSAGF